jgi:hypothetical protein
MDDDYLNPLPNKLLPRGFRRRLTTEEELRDARNSLAYWWFRCLQAHDEYQYCCKHRGRGSMASMYADFGDVFELDFTKWWSRHGRTIFAETKPFKRVRTVQSRADLRDLDVWNEDKLILEIPLTVTKQTVMRQIEQAVKKAYDGRVIDVMQFATARRKVLKNKIRTSTIEQLLYIKSLRDTWPAVTLYELGVKADIELNLMSRTKGEVPDEATRRRRMTIAVRRLLTNAERLVANAGMGKFPSFQKHS